MEALINLNFVKILIVAAFFPVPLSMGGIDLACTSIYLIILTFMYCNVLYCVRTGDLRIRNTVQSKMIVLLLALSLFSTVSVIWEEWSMFRASFWSFSYMVAAGMFYFLVDNMDYGKKEKDDVFNELITLFLIMVAVQILFSISCMYFPQLNYIAYKFIHARTGWAWYNGSMAMYEFRLQTLVFPAESLGEIIAVVSPLIFYRLIGQTKILDLVCLTVLLAGLYYAGTRSGALLFAVSFFIVLFLTKGFSLKTFIFVIVTIGSITLLYYKVGGGVLFQRLVESYNGYQSGESLLEVSNRSFFTENVGFFLDKLSFFGNGLVSPLKYHEIRFDFHNLYMTLVFRYGVIGGLVYLSLPLMLLIGLLKRYNSSGKCKKYLIISLSILIFFINECKYEFTRKDGYVLIIWILFSIYSIALKKKIGEIKK